MFEFLESLGALRRSKYKAAVRRRAIRFILPPKPTRVESVERPS